MSTSVYVSAIKPADETFRKHEAVWNACIAADVDIPAETADYFDDEEPDAAGVVVGLGSLEFPTGPAKPWRNEHFSGVEVDLASLPAGTKTLRVWWG